MGLAVSVGVVAEWAGENDELAAECRDELDCLSAALAVEGVIWREPDGTEVPPRRESYGSMPYSWLHYLRRILAMVDDGKPVSPVVGDDLSAEDEEQIEDMTMMFESHLLCHSDSEGFYVPVDFDPPLVLDGDAEVSGGGMVGSSQGLLDELRRCAPPLGVRLDEDGSLPDDEAARLFKLTDAAEYWIESVVWLTLHEACRASIAGGHAIVFQ